MVEFRGAARELDRHTHPVHIVHETVFWMSEWHCFTPRDHLWIAHRRVGIADFRRRHSRRIKRGNRLRCCHGARETLDQRVHFLRILYAQVARSKLLARWRISAVPWLQRASEQTRPSARTGR